jgi:hypothetical protein
MCCAIAARRVDDVSYVDISETLIASPNYI